MSEPTAPPPDAAAGRGRSSTTLVGGTDPAAGQRGGRPRRHPAGARRPRTASDAEVADRLLHLADTEGIETIAEVWSGSPADSLAGCLWRLYLLRSWVYADPVGVAREFEAGRRRAQVARVVAGVADPPGPDELKAMVDEVLRGIAGGDFADVLFRAAAFARVVATGRAALPDADRRRACAGCWAWPSSSRPPATSSSTAAWPEEPAEQRPSRTRLTLECAGPRQPRVPKLAATSGHAP